jgi:hypothetical protein
MTSGDTAEWEDLVFTAVICIACKLVVVIILCSYQLQMLNKSNYQSKHHVLSLICDNINKESDSKHLLLNFWFMILEHMPHYNMLKLIHLTLRSVYVMIFRTIMDEWNLYQSMIVQKYFSVHQKWLSFTSSETLRKIQTNSQIKTVVYIHAPLI